MNVLTAACLLIWSSCSLLSMLHALFSGGTHDPWPGGIMFALSLLGWRAFTGPDNLDRPDERTSLRDKDRW